MLVLASSGPPLPGTRKSCSWLGRPAFQTGQQACGEHYSADQQENCQWKEKFSFSRQEKQKICGHFRELLMETDGNVCREVERPQLGERLPHGETPQRPTRTACPRDLAEILALRNPTSTHALHFPSFLILPSHLFYSPSFLEWSSRKK